jgi:hypothetical protein
MKTGGADERWVRSKLSAAIVSLALLYFKIQTKFFRARALQDKSGILLII